MDTSVLTKRKFQRRGLMKAAAGFAAGSASEHLPTAPAEGTRPRIVFNTAAEGGTPMQTGPEFGLLGVFDVDWLTEPRFTRLLDNVSASPGGFHSIRFFGSLTSGQRENTLPTARGDVWNRRADTPNFAATFAALDALVSRRLVPFLTLSFFPPAVSDKLVNPPSDYSPWQELVRIFIEKLAARYGAERLVEWHFEVWNEPNFPPFWAGNFDQYLDLYRATNEAVKTTSQNIRLGGPALVYTPDSDGAALMERFLTVLAQVPELQCDFISYHRKGSWSIENDRPWLGGQIEAARQIADSVLRLVPGRARNLELINNEADMKVGFDRPFEPRLTERFPSWLSASLATHTALNAEYAAHGLRFIAASDNANQQLIRAPFDGRRSVMTMASGAPIDLIKLPVYSFYELLPFLTGRRLEAAPESAGVEDLYDIATADTGQIGVLFTIYADRSAPEEAGPPTQVFDCVVENIPWDRINLVCFRIDHQLTNAYSMWQRMRANPSGDTPDAIRHLRDVQELAAEARMRSGLPLPQRRLTQTISLPCFATILLWITPFTEEVPTGPNWITTEASEGDAIVRWAPNRRVDFYSYEVFRIGENDNSSQRVSAFPLRSAMWVDTKPGAGVHSYAVRAITASGIPSAFVKAAPLSM